MTLDQTHLEMTRGDELVFDFGPVRNEVTQAIENLTGATVWMTAKRDFNDTDAEKVFQKKTGGSGIALDVGAGGTGTVTVAPSDTSPLEAAKVQLVWDLQVKPSGGQPRTVARGTLTVRPDVTVSTS